MEFAAQFYMIFLSLSILLLYSFRNALKGTQMKIILVCFVCLGLTSLVFLPTVGKIYESLGVMSKLVIFLFIPASYMYTLIHLLRSQSRKREIAPVQMGVVKFIPGTMPSRNKSNQVVQLNRETPKKQTSSLHLSQERMREMAVTIKEYFIKTRPFLQHGYSLRMLSDETHIPLHHLSAFINQFYKMNFNDFINEYRILSCIDKLLKKEWEFKKLEAIAEESGFNNRNTFTSAFKKATGLNPSEFLKYIKQGKIQKNKPPYAESDNDEEMSRVCKLMSKLAG
jgi:AraC-like DNA-binding protein